MKSPLSPTAGPVNSVGWSASGNALRILDQTQLPEREVYLDLVLLDDVVDAIRTLMVRGAPAIGVAAAIGLYACVEHESHGDEHNARELLPVFAARISASRPTAVNLAWAINRMLFAGQHAPTGGLFASIHREADDILTQDEAVCRRIGEAGATLLRDGANILTHCNAGALATAGIGTALAPVYVALEQGRAVHVYADETRPLRQGARLTAWELTRAGVDVTVLPDGAAASLLRDGKIDAVIVGADRIAFNGDVANKIGTYPLALAAHAHNVPFYVAAPFSTFDFTTNTGFDIVIEQRAASELSPLPPNVRVYNPAFDVTPSHLITAYISDHGIVKTPFTDKLYLASSPLEFRGVPS